MSDDLAAARQAERDLNSHEAKTGAGRESDSGEFLLLVLLVGGFEFGLGMDGWICLLYYADIVSFYSRHNGVCDCQVPWVDRHRGVCCFGPGGQ